MRNLSLGLPTKFDTNQTVQPQKMARSFKFRIKEVKGVYCLCSEIKSVDQLHGHCAAYLRLFFSICKSQVFLMMRLNFLGILTLESRLY